MALRGDIIGEANSGKTAIDKVKCTLSSAAQALDAVDLSSTGVVIAYLDSDQALNCTNGSGSGSSSCFWTTNRVIGTGDLVDSGEQVGVTVNLSNMTLILCTTRLSPWDPTSVVSTGKWGDLSVGHVLDR